MDINTANYCADREDLITALITAEQGRYAQLCMAYTAQDDKFTWKSSRIWASK